MTSSMQFSKRGGVSILSTTVCDLKENTFYALVEIKTANGTIKKVDARPSDAIALALKTRVPIWVVDSVMDSAAVSNEPVNRSSIEQIAYLHQKLKECVEAEAYEEAAKIRDHIRSLEAKLGKASDFPPTESGEEGEEL